jgi:hypothetical protein
MEELGKRLFEWLVVRERQLCSYAEGSYAEG